MDLRKKCTARRSELIGLLKRLVELESPTGVKSAVDRCSHFIVCRFENLEARIRRYPQRDTGDLYSIDLFSKPGGDERPGILILLHADTVWPVGRLGVMPFQIRGDRIYGPGALDMKAGIVMALTAASLLHEFEMPPSRPVRIFLNSCEETGSPASESLVRKLALGSRAVLCLEPAIPGGALKMRRKGRLVVRLDCRGRSAHAGRPDRGVSAIDELSRQIRRLRRLEKGGVTVNPGIVSGGNAVNVVAEEARAMLDIRFPDRSRERRVMEYFETLIPALEGAGVDITVESRTLPLELTPASLALFSKARRIARGMNMPLRRGSTGGNSDASLIADLGIPILDGLGPDGNGIHAPDEHVLIPSLIDRTALLTELLRKI